MSNKDMRIIQTKAGKAQVETHMSIGISHSLKKKIKEVAREQGLSASELIRRAVEDYVYPFEIRR